MSMTHFSEQSHVMVLLHTPRQSAFLVVFHRTNNCLQPFIHPNRPMI